LKKLKASGKKHTVGYRYWGLDKAGRLTAPLNHSALWAPGVNSSACTKGKCSFTGCSCGLYAFKHTGKGICDSTYFDPETATVKGQKANTVVGAVALWDAVHAWGGAVRAPYGVPTAFALPKNASAETKNRIKKAAAIYQVEIVDPKNLKAATDEWIKETLPKFDD
jgi:hypothetical protein